MKGSRNKSEARRRIEKMLETQFFDGFEQATGVTSRTPDQARTKLESMNRSGRFPIDVMLPDLNAEKQAQIDESRMNAEREMAEIKAAAAAASEAE